MPMKLQKNLKLRILTLSLMSQQMKLKLHHTFSLGISASAMLQTLFNNHNAFAIVPRTCPDGSLTPFAEKDIYCQSDSASIIFSPIIFALLFVSLIAIIIFVVNKHRQNKTKSIHKEVTRK